MRGAILSCVWLLACGAASEEGEDMNRRIRGIPVANVVPEQWGQQRSFAVGQLPRLIAGAGGSAILKLNPLPKWRIPRVQTLIAAVENQDVDVAQRYFLRWTLTTGVGGARTSVQFDAVGFTRLNLPAEQLELALAYEPYAGGSDSPAGVVTAHGYVGDFATDGGDPGPTYTTYFSNTFGGGTTEIPVPPGARRFRLIGDVGSANNPFSSPASELAALQGGTTIARWLPAPAAAGDPSLWALFYTGDFVALPGNATKLSFLNGVGGTQEGFIQFGLDL